MDAPVSILMVEDSPFDAELEVEHLTSAGIKHEIRRVDTRAMFIKELGKSTPDLILCDYALPGFDGLAALEIAHELSPDVPFIFVSGAIGEEVAIESLKHGATDYVLKHRLQRLAPAAERALSEARQRRERAQTEEELARKIRELSVLNADLEQFAYAANHDLQEPLRMISLFSELLATKYGEDLNGEANEYLRQIENGAKRMSALIEELLLYAKVPARDDGHERADLNQVVNQTLKLFEQAVKENGALVTCDPMPVVRGNADRLGLVVQNLIANALKYRGTAAPHIHIGATAHRDGWLISVKDNGTGFDQAYSDQIFGLFKKLNKEPEGTGLGLAICKRIVELHGGRIWAESQPNCGATFFFSLPAAEAATGAQAGTKSA